MKRLAMTALALLASTPAWADTPGPTVVPLDGDAAAVSSDNFTGEVAVGPRIPTIAPSRIGGAVVRFAAGARTNWHTHPADQLLTITEGCAWIGIEGGDVIAVPAGHVVVVPPGARHWHGASPAGPMAHLALTEGIDGLRVTWMEPVADADYAAPESADACTG